MVLSARPTVVARRELFARLSAGNGRAVTVLSAPAGSGKTVLLRSWIEYAGLDDRVAWVTVERDEQDAQRVWASVVEALRAASGADTALEPLAPTPAFDGTEARPAFAAS